MKHFVKIPALTLMLSACSTITFEQYQQPGEQPSENRWHHMALNGIVEISRPLDLKPICGDRTWNSITTEYTVLNAITSAIVPSVPFVVTYTPYTIKVECFQPTASAGVESKP